MNTQVWTERLYTMLVNKSSKIDFDYSLITAVYTPMLNPENALTFSRQKVNWTLPQVPNRWMRAIVILPASKPFDSVHFQSINVDFFFFASDGYLGYFIISVLSGYQLIKYLFYNLRNRLFGRANREKKNGLPEQCIQILFYFTWGSNKTSLPRFHQRFNLGFLRKDSKENIYMMASGSNTDKIPFNTQSIWHLPKRKTSKRTRKWHKCPFMWYPKRCANSFGIFLLE